VARYRLLPLTLAVQVGAVDEEAHRGVRAESARQLRCHYAARWKQLAPCHRRLPFYQDKLYEEKVFKRFAEILSKARSNKQANKPDAELNEFETVRLLFPRRVNRSGGVLTISAPWPQILENHKKSGEEGQELDAAVAKTAQAATRRKAATGGKKAAPAKRASTSSTSFVLSAPVVLTRALLMRSRFLAAARNRRAVRSDDDDDDDELAAPVVSPRKKSSACF
jgi:hypothetical protein